MISSHTGRTLEIVPDEMPGSHCGALSRPVDLAERLEAYQKGLVPHAVH